MQWIKSPVALRWRLDHSQATPAIVGSRATVLWRSAIALALRCYNAADECRIPLTNVRRQSRAVAPTTRYGASNRCCRQRRARRAWSENASCP